MTDEKLSMPVVAELTEARNEATVDGVTYLQVVPASIKLGLYPNYAGKLCAEGDINAVRDSRKRIWISTDEIDAFIKARAETPRRGGRTAYRTDDEKKAARKAYSKAHQLPLQVKNLKAAIKLVNGLDTQAQAKQDVLDALGEKLKAALKVHVQKLSTGVKAEVDAEAEADEEFQKELS